MNFLPYLNRTRVPRSLATPADTALAAALRRDVEMLALNIGPRGYHAPHAYALAQEFLTTALTSAGYTVTRHVVQCVDGSRASNLVAELPGRLHPQRVIVVGAHYDSVEKCPAANDNASGVAGVLAVARALAGNPRDATVRFVLFANEEPPHFNMNTMGSQEYARMCRTRGDDIRGMICLETIGCYSDKPGSQKWPIDALSAMLGTRGDFICMIGNTASRDFIRRCSEAFERAETFSQIAAAAPESIDMINWSDHRGFNEVGYDAFMVTDTAPLRYEHYHARTDTPEKLDYDSVARVMRGVIAMTCEVADSC